VSAVILALNDSPFPPTSSHQRWSAKPIPRRTSVPARSKTVHLICKCFFKVNSAAQSNRGSSAPNLAAVEGSSQARITSPWPAGSSPLEMSPQTISLLPTTCRLVISYPVPDENDEPSADFRRIPLCDIDLQDEIRFESNCGVVRRRRLHPAKIDCGTLNVTVAMYEGDGAKKVGPIMLLNMVR
jgi:hypothetical protein